MMSVEEESRIGRLADEGLEKTALEFAAKPKKVTRSPRDRRANGGRNLEDEKEFAEEQSTPTKIKKERRLKTGKASKSQDTSVEEASNVMDVRKDNPSAEERIPMNEGLESKAVEKDGRSKKDDNASTEDMSQTCMSDGGRNLEDENEFAEEQSAPTKIKKERRSKRETVTFAAGCNGLEEGGSRPTKEKKERRSKTGKSDMETVSPEASKLRKFRTECKSKTDNPADVENGSASAEERPKPGKSKKERRSRTGTETELVLEQRSKKKDKKKSRKKPQNIQHANMPYGSYGLSAMVEPWALLKTVVKSHRDEVHVLKDIMDFHAAKTGDRTMLNQLQKLLTQIDKEKSSNYDIVGI